MELSLASIVSLYRRWRSLRIDPVIRVSAGEPLCRCQDRERQRTHEGWVCFSQVWHMTVHPKFMLTKALRSPSTGFDPRLLSFLSRPYCLVCDAFHDRLRSSQFTVSAVLTSRVLFHEIS
jgi:hypothetical protein